MIRTRVGYAGGTAENPTYHNLGDHSETIQIDYDPTVITYEQLLDVFWEAHNPTTPRGSVQYRSAILYNSGQQRKMAESSMSDLSVRLGKRIWTEIEPLDQFYLAEDYHQKFRLRNLAPADAEFNAIYPNLNDYVNSTATMRVNAFLGGYGTIEDLERVEAQLGLSEETISVLKQRLVQLGWVIDCI